MHRTTLDSVLNAIREHPSIEAAAITGSFAARRHVDELSDLDVLVVARDVDRVGDILAWWPQAGRVSTSAAHLSHYWTVLTEDMEKFDIAVYSDDDPPSRWVVRDYEIIKGDENFRAQLDEAARSTRERAAHLDADVSIDNVLLLLVTARRRAARGELLSAHEFLSMACDMLLALETREGGVLPEADPLDPRRRLERMDSEKAAAFHESLFTTPENGIRRLAHYIETAHRDTMARSQTAVLSYLRSDR